MAKKADLIDKFIGYKIKLKRIELGYSQAEIGRILGISYQQVQKCEWGMNRIPISRLYKLAEVFKINISCFFEGVEKINYWENEDFKRLREKNEVLCKEIHKLNLHLKNITNEESKNLILKITKHLAEID